MDPQTIMERLLFATVRITADLPGGTSTGTGFVYTHHHSNGLALHVVTNKHVVEGADRVVLHFMASDDAGNPILGQECALVIDDVAGCVRGHPDPEVDIATMPLGGRISQDAHPTGYWTRYMKSVNSSLAATTASLQNFEPVEAVTFVGYPNGLFDSHSLLPIVRRGISASALNIDYEGKPQFLIDASVFPGSSGSPVFLLKPASSPNKHGGITIGGPPVCLFLGVVAAVYQRQVPVLQTSVTERNYVDDAIDIGIVYKASAVNELVDQVVAEDTANSARINAALGLSTSPQDG